LEFRFEEFMSDSFLFARLHTQCLCRGAVHFGSKGYRSLEGALLGSALGDAPDCHLAQKRRL
jgi:hypothetical protein